MNLFGRSSSRRRSSEASSSSNSVHRSYVEQSANSIRDAATKSCLWSCDDSWSWPVLKKNSINISTTPSSVPTSKISATNISALLNHLPKNLNSILMNPEYHLSYMAIHLIYLWRHFLITAILNFGVHWTNHQGRSLRYAWLAFAMVRLEEWRKVE